MIDQNNPDRFLDTAYNALKGNPGATNQILQAAAQGQPVGLRGLAAAAAQQNQQQAQQAMAAQQMQGPQPSVIQKMAQMPGIMGQLPANMDLAQAPTEQAPQMMAGGGLVAFADGGLVLPPDVIDAIQSHFAEGGEVRGFYEGEDISAAPSLIPSSLTEAIQGMLSPSPGRPRDIIAAEKEAELDKARRTPPSGILTALQNLVSPSPGNRAAVQEDVAFDTDTGADDQAKLDALLGERPRSETPKDAQGKKIPKPAVWKPESTSGHEVTAKPEVHPEGQKLAPEFDKAKLDLPTAPEADKKEQAGLGSLGGGNLEALRDQLMELSGHKTMSPELSQKLEDLQSSARTSTILQSLLGGLAGGLSSPYGGRFALGKSAAGALAGYQHGIGAEESLGTSAFNILKGYEDAPAEEKAAAMKAIMGQLSEAGKTQAQLDIAEGRAENAIMRDILKGGYAQRRAETMANARPNYITQQEGNNVKQAEAEYNDWLAAEQKLSMKQIPESTLTAKRREFYRLHNVEHLLAQATGANYPQGAVQSGGIGGGQPGIFITR